MASQIRSIIQLGLGFLFIFTAFQSCSNIQEYVIQNIAAQSKNSTDTISPQAGYTSLAIIYGVFTLFNFAAPLVVSKISNKWAIVVGGVSYILFLASFLQLSDWLFYTCSAVLGIGAALIWVGQGSYLTENSDDESLSRNSGIFWAILQCSLPLGGIFVYFQLKNDVDKVNLSPDTVRFIYVGFTCLTILGAIILLFLPKTQPKRKPEDRQSLLNPSDGDGQQNEELVISADHLSVQVDSVTRAPLSDSKSESLIGTLCRVFSLAKTGPMLLLSVVFIYTGIELTFWSGLYGTSVANTLSFKTPSKQLLALNTIFIGLGEIVGGALFGVCGHRFNKIGRNPIILLSTLVHLSVFFVIFLNIPAEAPMMPTHAKSYLEPNEYLALFCSILVGFGDACWNTQVYSLLGSLYSEDSAPAFGLFKFFQSGSACAAFFYSGYLALHWQLLILASIIPLAAVAFFNVEWKAQALAERHEKHP